MPIQLLRSRSATRGPLSLLAALTLASALMLWTAPGARAEEPNCHDTAAEPSAHSDHAGHAEHRSADAERASGLDLPNVELVDQDGHAVHLYQDLIEDRVVAMNFIFTTCTTICPPMGASFGKLQRELGELLGDPVKLVSVSIDPTTDTPPRLKSWGAKFGAGDSWSLLTGSKQDVDQVLRALEVFTPTPEDHGPIVLLGNDRTDQWVRVNGLTPPSKLAAMLEELATDHRPTAGKESR
ncbi:MAG: SCO family protein [Acidobacteriota bacterium]|nr:SCO family protein [Acidobacteriota bacterium]